MRKTTFLLVVALVVAFFGLTLVAYGLPKDKQAPAPAATTTAKPAVQKPAVRPGVVEATDDNLNVSAPAYRLPENPGYIGPQPNYPAFNGVPAVNVRRGSPETGGGNNHMRRQVKANPATGVVHMMYRIFDSDSGEAPGRWGDTVYSPADSNTNGVYYYNAYNCSAGQLECNYTTNNGKCYAMNFPATLPETRPSVLATSGGVFLKPSSGRAVVYAQRFIRRSDLFNGAFTLKTWGTATEAAECTPSFSLDTSYTASTAPAASAPVIRPLDDNVWVATLRNGGFPEEIAFSYTTDAGVNWSTRVTLATNSPWFNSSEIASFGYDFWIVSMTDPADPTAFQTTERPVYLKGTYTPGPNTVTFGTMQDITGPFELPGFLPNMIDIAATNIEDTLVVAWTDWNNWLGNGFAGPGGHVHAARIDPTGNIDIHKIANINIDGRLAKMTTTAFGFGVDPWGEIELSYDASGDNLYCIWNQPPDDGNFGWADYDYTGTLAVHDLFRSTSPNHGVAWDNPENITQTNNPGCGRVFGNECGNEWWFSADDRAVNDTVNVLALVNAMPGIQESAEFIIPGDVGPFTRNRDRIVLYKMPADTAKRDLRADLNTLPTDTLKLFQVTLAPGGSAIDATVRLENIGLLDFTLNGVDFDPTFTSGGLSVTSNQVNGTTLFVGGSPYDFQFHINPSGVPFTQQGLHSGVVTVHLSSVSPNSPEGAAAVNVDLNVNLSIYVVQTLCGNRKVNIHSGSNNTDIGSQGSIKDQSGNGMLYDFDGSDHFYDGGDWVYRSNLNAAAGVPGVPRKVSRQIFSDKFLRCVTDIVLDSTAGTGPYYNLYAVSISTDVEDTSVLFKNIWEQSTHADSSDFLLQTVKLWNIGSTASQLAAGVLYDIDVQGGGSAASENQAGDDTVHFNVGDGDRTFWLGWISGNDVTVDTCTPNNAYYGVVVIPGSIGSPGSTVRPAGAVMYEQQGFSYGIGNGTAAGGDSLCQRYSKDLNVTISASAGDRAYDTLTGVWLDTLGAGIGSATICGGVANPLTYRDNGAPYRNDMGYMTIARRVTNFAPSAPLANVASRYGLEGAGAQLASSVDSSFPGSLEYQVIHLVSVSGLTDLKDHARKAIAWAYSHHNLQTGPYQIDTTGQSHYFKTTRRGDLNFNGGISGPDVAQEILYLFAGFRTFNVGGYPTEIPFCVADVDHNGATAGSDLARLLFYFSGSTGLCPTCLQSCGF